MAIRNIILEKPTCPFCQKPFEIFSENGIWTGRCESDKCFWMPECATRDEVMELYRLMMGLSSELHEVYAKKA